MKESFRPTGLKYEILRFFFICQTQIMVTFEEYSYRMKSGEEFVITMYFDVLLVIFQTQFVFDETK